MAPAHVAHPYPILKMSVSTAEISPSTTMAELLAAYPGAQRALFAGYHIGGCSSCAFHASETLAELCARNDNLSVDEVIAHIGASHEKDSELMLEPAQAAERLRDPQPPLLLDVRTREEHEAVSLPDANLLTQDSLQQVFATCTPDQPILIYDHTGGGQALDVAAYFIGHGFTDTKVLAGGIDAWSQQVDPSLPRYKIEMDG